jgi:hypothetical protein
MRLVSYQRDGKMPAKFWGGPFRNKASPSVPSMPLVLAALPECPGGPWDYLSPRGAGSQLRSPPPLSLQIYLRGALVPGSTG